MLNLLVGFGFRIERAITRVLRLEHRGVQALAFAPSGALILLELRYLRGWHLPGGRIKRNETAQTAILRELYEEIGEVQFSRIEEIGAIDEVSRGIPTRIALFRIDDVVVTRRRWPNLEVRSLCAFDLDNLPEHAETARDRLKRANDGNEF